jgi:RNA ligase partner protein
MPSRKPDRIFVIDTSLFVNPQCRIHFGKTPSLAVSAFVKLVRSLNKNHNMKIFMPPAIFSELKNFLDKKSIDSLELIVILKSPSLHELKLPAAIFHDFIEDLRSRVNKGLRLAEDFAKDNAPDNDTKLKKLREKYKEAMRSGILDSKEDLELVLLAKELDAVLITGDEGAMKFAKDLGCSFSSASKFHSLLKSMKK